MGLQSATMNDIASWLRAQMPSATDPDRLERLAREAERQAALRSGIATLVRSAYRAGREDDEAWPEPVGAGHLQQRPHGPQYDPAQTG